jgi:glycosyltransferase involved in cell wall biosynthesis
MKILFATRIFSGFESSVNASQWRPSGAPTVYKLLETLIARGDDLSLIFMAKTHPDACDIATDQTIDIDGLARGIKLLAGPVYFRRWPKRLRWYLTEVRHTLQIVAQARKFQPDIIYLDRGNYVAAGLLARFGHRKIVYRMMGVPPDFAHAWKGKSLFQNLLKWCLKSPFNLVICTQDGSGGEVWLNRLLAEDTPRTMLLNGVDLPESCSSSISFLANLPAEKTVVLLLGRLEALKRPLEFLSGFREANEARPDMLHAVVIGDGILRAEMIEQARQHNLLQHMDFIGSVDHETALQAFTRCDIYVSLNSQGNLSNSNLEAIRSGCCVIFPIADVATGRDVATDRMFPDNTIYRIPSVGRSGELSKAITFLHDHPTERVDRAERTKEMARTVINSWSERIQKEITALETLV